MQHYPSQHIHIVIYLRLLWTLFKSCYCYYYFNKKEKRKIIIKIKILSGMEIKKKNPKKLDRI